MEHNAKDDSDGHARHTQHTEPVGMTPHRRPSTHRIRVDLHAHTRHSPDAVLPPAQLVERAREAGLGRLAVTDHGTIEGALEAREIDRDLVIVGEEIKCRCGTELIGLFLSERIPMRLRIEEVVERIRAQDGVIYAPHPYAYALRPRWHLERALGVADVVEAFNARAFLPAWNRRADLEARTRGLPRAASSDAHFLGEIGRAYTEMPTFSSAPAFRMSLDSAEPVALRVTHPAVHVASRTIMAFRVVASECRRLVVEEGRRPVPATG